MSKAEKFIEVNTRNCSNQIAHWDIGGENVKPIYSRWLTPDQAKEAVEIAREEMIEWLRKNHEEYQYKAPYNYFDIEQCINDLKQAMKDE